jgi:hypothetical protein
LDELALELSEQEINFGAFIFDFEWPAKRVSLKLSLKLSWGHGLDFFPEVNNLFQVHFILFFLFLSFIGLFFEQFQLLLNYLDFLVFFINIIFHHLLFLMQLLADKFAGLEGLRKLGLFLGHFGLDLCYFSV